MRGGRYVCANSGDVFLDKNVKTTNASCLFPVKIVKGGAVTLTCLSAGTAEKSGFEKRGRVTSGAAVGGWQKERGRREGGQWGGKIGGGEWWWMDAGARAGAYWDLRRASLRLGRLRLRAAGRASAEPWSAMVESAGGTM